MTRSRPENNKGTSGGGEVGEACWGREATQEPAVPAGLFGVTGSKRNWEARMNTIAVFQVWNSSEMVLGNILAVILYRSPWKRVMVRQ